MKVSLSLIALLQIASIGFKSALAAPASVESTLENEIADGVDDNVKLFREKYALRVKSYMNLSVDPCDDFYEYACGNFPNAIEDLEVNRKRSNLLDIFFVLAEYVDQILNKTRHEDEEHYEELQKAKQFVDSCANANLWPIEPSEEYLEAVKAIGGFPAVDPSWQASTFDWLNMTAHLTRYGIEGLIKEEIYLKHPFPPYYELPKLGFDFDVYFENIDTNKSQGYVHNEEIMRNLLKVYGVTGPKADEVIEGVIKFWKDVLVAERWVSSFGDCVLASMIDGIDDYPRWSQFFNIAWETTDFNVSEISECPCPSFYTRLDEIVSRHREAAANYMALKFLHTMHPQLKSTKFVRLNCVTRVKHALPLILTHFYMKEHYNKEAEEDILEIISNLKESLTHLVETADWMDESSRSEALNKARTLRTHIGRIIDPISETFIHEMRRLNFTDSFAANNLQLAKFSVDMHHYGYLHQDIPETTMPNDILDAVQVNAFYYVLENTINVMAGILHPPVYHPSLPNSVKYGALGYIVGHELTHGFDNLGSHFDANLTMRYWWSEKSGQIIEERSNCFAQHYSDYKVPEMKKKINGTKSQNENIADSGGLREALAAYRKILKEAAKSKQTDFLRKESLPGLDLSPEQTFFLSFSQVYCSKYTPKHFWVEISDDHPVDKYRVTGTLQNFEEFSLVYNCPLGSPMNPNEKCRLW